jgi:hypothetical protein
MTLRIQTALATVLALGAWGCSSGVGPTLSDGGVAPTWHKDVQPIVQQRCQSCHTAGGIAPFSLDSYLDAKGRNASMASAVTGRRMPPWLPSESCQSFQGSRRLPTSEVETISGWSEGGALEGNPADAPGGTADAGSGLGWIDSTLSMAEPYTPNSATTDDYRCFIVDPQLSTNRDVIGMDIVPGVRRMVHHVLVYAGSKTDVEALDNGEAGPGWTCFGGPGLQNPTLVGGWVPGTVATQYPTNTGIRVNAGQVLVMQVHYNLQNGGAAPDNTSLRVQYSKSPVPKPATILPMIANFSIPPKAVGYSAVGTTTSLPFAMKLWGVIPHMHVKGRTIRVDMGDTCLVDIPQWDFHWQQFFFYQQPLNVPASTSVKLTCTWDNPTDKTIVWGEGTEDEMCLSYFYLTL